MAETGGCGIRQLGGDFLGWGPAWQVGGQLLGATPGAILLFVFDWYPGAFVLIGGMVLGGFAGLAYIDHKEWHRPFREEAQR